MKKIISGALYNTETAKEIGNWSNNLSSSDFNSMSETLYRTKSGKYFICGEGGPMTKYAKSSGNNSWSGGSNIEPVSPAGAADWAQENLDADDYATAFGEPDEAAEGREALNISLPRELKLRLERMRSETGNSISKIIEDALK